MLTLDAIRRAIQAAAPAHTVAVALRPQDKMEIHATRVADGVGLQLHVSAPRDDVALTEIVNTIAVWIRISEEETGDT